MKTRGLSTELLHSEVVPPGHIAPITTPIFESATFIFDSARDLRAFNEGRAAGYLYSRHGNPTVAAVEGVLATLDGAEGALLFPSGMAATLTLLMAHAKAGDEVVCSAALYGGTVHLLTGLLAKFGLVSRFVPVDALQEPAAILHERTRILWFESPINPTLRCVDVAAIASACRSRGVLSVLDNTFASPVNQRPLALGVDLAMQSATKYLNGHSDLTAGVVAGSRELLQPIAAARIELGTVLDALPAYALGRGLKTLPLRVARQNATAQIVAEALERDRRVSRVYYPGLLSHPDHEIARRQMAGFGGMICFDLGGDDARAERLYDSLSLIKRAASLGGVESIVSLPVLTSHWGHTGGQLEAAGVTPGMVRLSVGLEDAADLVDDLNQALG